MAVVDSRGPKFLRFSRGAGGWGWPEGDWRLWGFRPRKADAPAQLRSTRITRWARPSVLKDALGCQ